MNTDFNQQDMLNEVFGDAAPPELRAEILHQTLREVRRQKLFRRRLRLFSTTIAVAAVLVVGTRSWFVPKARVHPSPDTFLIHSQSLDRQTLVTTAPATAHFVHSFDLADTLLLRTSQSDRDFQLITDKQLLALLREHTAALVYRSPDRAELIFSNPAEQNGFPTQ